MPHSDFSNKPWMSRQIERIAPASVLDVGPGSGTYGRIVRDVAPGARLVGVEAWEPYIDEFALRDVYDEILVQDARELDDWSYDLVIFGDVLEHMSEADASLLWAKAASGRGRVLMSIPIIHYPQCAEHGNPYEVHVVEDWSHERVLNVFPGIVDFEVFAVTGAYLADFSSSFSVED